MPPTDPLKINIDPVFTGNRTSDNEAKPAGAYGILNNQAYSQSAKSSYAPPAPNPKGIPQKSVVRTYRSDLESAIERDHLSSVNIAIAQNQKMRESVQPTPTPANESEYSKSKVLIFLSVILIVIGLGAFAGVYLSRTGTGTETVTVQELPSLFTAEYKDELNTGSIAKNKFATALSSRLNDTQVPANNFYNVYITTGSSTSRRLVTAGELVSLLDFSLPDIIKRNLETGFMVGAYSNGENYPFLVLKATSYENTYAGMLAWEKGLKRDFQVLFRLPGYETSGSLAAQLAPTDTGVFQDSVIVNKDVRLVRDDNGRTLLLYSIIDKETIIITTDENAFKSIMDRLNKEKGLQR